MLLGILCPLEQKSLLVRCTGLQLKAAVEEHSMSDTHDQSHICFLTVTAEGHRDPNICWDPKGCFFILHICHRRLRRKQVSGSAIKLALRNLPWGGN